MGIKYYCINCGKPSEKYNHVRSGKRSNPHLRPTNSITCSPKCSKEWKRKNNGKWQKKQ